MPSHGIFRGSAEMLRAVFSPLELRVIHVALQDRASPQASQSRFGRWLGKLFGDRHRGALANTRLEVLRSFIANKPRAVTTESICALSDEGFSAVQVRALLALSETVAADPARGNHPKAVVVCAATMFLVLFVASAPERRIEVTVYGDDPCPQAKGDEIVVCAQELESERYRIPKRLREPKRTDVTSQSWAARVRTLEEASRPSMPGSCSPVGSGGQTGCTAMMLQQWFAERRASAVEAARIP